MIGNVNSKLRYSKLYPLTLNVLHFLHESIYFLNSYKIITIFEVLTLIFTLIEF